MSETKFQRRSLINRSLRYIRGPPTAPSAITSRTAINEESCFQVPICFLAVFGLFFDVFVCWSNAWTKNDPSGAVIESQRRTFGLWASCVEDSTGIKTCDGLDTFWVNLPIATIIGRLFCVVAIGLQLVSVTLQPFGMRCAKLIPNKKTKKQLMIAASACSFAAGVLVAVAVSWFAANTASQYMAVNRFQGMSGNRFGNNYVGQNVIWAEGIYLGWFAALIQIAQGLIGFCQNSDCGEPDCDYDDTATQQQLYNTHEYA